MKKSISYYFSDHSRLDEVSTDDLKSWLDEAPYSQPIHKLLSLKSARSGQSVADHDHQNAAYHNIDIDIAGGLGEAQIKSIIRDSSPSIINTNTAEKTTSVLLSHPAASDTNEQLVEHELMEDEGLLLGEQVIDDTSEGEEVKIVSHTMASDELEELVEEEVTESEAILVESTVYENNTEEIDYYLDHNLIYLDVMAEVINDSTDILQPITVNYDSKDIDILSELGKEEKGVDVVAYVAEESSSKSKKKKSKKRSKKKASIKSKKKPAKTIGQKKKSKTEEKIKSKKTKPKQNKKTAVNLKKSKRKNTISKKSKTTQPIAKEVRYVYIEERQEPDFRVHEYNGESDYIKWLMDKKSINQEKIVAEKKSKKGKSKKVEVANKVKKKKSVDKKVKNDVKKESKKKVGDKKKSKPKKISAKKMVLKAAEESVKKRDVIISQTLADLLAAQGYDKKAKKMYKQLSLIFPEKSSFFAARIKKLKKK